MAEPSQQHSLIQAPIREEITEGGPRQSGCSCTGRMVAQLDHKDAYWDFRDHLVAAGVSEKDRLPLLDEAWETLTGKKD